MTERNYPFRGPRFKVGDRVRVKRDSFGLFALRFQELYPDIKLKVETERIENVDVDPDGQPYTLDFSHQLVALEDIPGEHDASHFEPA